MIDKIENFKELNALLIDKKISSITDNLIIEWYNRTSNKIESLRIRYRSFTIGSIINYLIIGLLGSFVIASFKYFDEVFQWVILLAIVSGIILLPFFLNQYYQFVNDVVEKEKEIIRQDLISVLIAQEELGEECFKRRLVNQYNKKHKKQLFKSHKLLIKLLFKNVNGTIQV